MSRALLITGATGKQGGALIRNLIKRKSDFEILAVTRDANSPSAQSLLKLSPTIRVVTGNLNQPDELFKNAKEATKLPIWGVFSVQVAIGVDAKSEARQGKALIDAALDNGAKYFVYSSVDRGGDKSDESPTNVPHFIHKHNIEQHLYEKTKAGEMDWTILRPVVFYENLVPGFLGKVFATSWEMSLKKEQTLQLVGTTDIGFFAAEAFSKPAEYKGKKISLAGDELTYAQFQTIFKQKTGEVLPTTFSLVGSFLHWMVKDFGLMFKWFRDFGYKADIPALKKVRPELMDFGTWLETESAWKSK